MGNIKTNVTAFLSAIILMGCTPKENADRPNRAKPQQDVTKVLLIGTFHYNNPGADVAKTKSFDILAEKSQRELELISDAIKEFGPTQIFVEWDYDEQMELDSLFERYRRGSYFERDDLNDFYKKNEIFQLAFRVARKNKLKRVYGIDYGETHFPVDSLMSVIREYGQIGLQQRISNLIGSFTEAFDTQIEEGSSLLDLTYYLNSGEMRALSNELHNEIPLLAGGIDNQIGPFLTSEWYKRNLCMWSMIQKNTGEKDERVMVLVGASHAAMLEQFIDRHDLWETIELRSLLEQSDKI